MRFRHIDIAKGITILAVIIGHFQILPLLHLQRLAFSFHMPLFFILAGVFFRPQPIGLSIRKDFIRLMIPLFITLIVYKIFCYLSGDYNAFVDLPFNLLGNASTPDVSTKFQGQISCIGILWFLLPMFWARQVYNCISALYPPLISRVKILILHQDL